MTTVSTPNDAPAATTPFRFIWRGAACAVVLIAGSAQAAQFTINGPGGSGAFGTSVTTLPNGNLVVTDPGFDAPGPIADVGAVYLYRPDGTLISTLRGSTVGDRVGRVGVVVLTNGNYVVRSPDWDNGAAVDAGAVTFGSGSSGISGVVSPANSLVGSSALDQVGSFGVTALTNGNYVVRSPTWDNGATVNAGAVTFGSGNSGIVGVVSPTNSLIGSAAQDSVGGSGVTALSNGNYVVGSRDWDNGAAVNAGAATFGSGSGGIVGVVSPLNSLVGTTAADRVGDSVTALTNGNYVLRSRDWDNGATVDAGAVTFGSGSGGIVGVVSPANSLIGTSANDQVGSGDVAALTNGNYVVSSRLWDNSATVDAGAVTFGSGTIGIVGVVSPANSLIGTSANDQVGSGDVAALTNGSYVVTSSDWDNGAAADAGAATFGAGSSGIVGVVSPANSLVGTTAQDLVGSFGVAALTNGNYVVRSPDWNNGAAVNAGAVTFGSGSSGLVGVVSPTNSLIGTSANDQVGNSSVTRLTNGNYAVSSTLWDNGATVNAGAVTFGSGSSGIVGVVSLANSLIGSSANDQVGIGVRALTNGNYVVSSTLWDNGGTANAGAITLALSNGSVVGPITSTHSVLGLVANQGAFQVSSYDAFRNQLAVGQPASNRVVLQRTGIATVISIIGDTPDPSIAGQPVTFTATLSAAPNAPTNGQVSFTASSGQSCVTATPTPISATAANYSCTIVFANNGTSTVVAEYTGSIIHAYSGSTLATHTTIANAVFANGFEIP